MQELELEYRGFRGSASYDPKNQVHYGFVLGITDRVSYRAAGLEGLVANFEAATDEYIKRLSSLGATAAGNDCEALEICLAVQTTSN